MSVAIRPADRNDLDRMVAWQQAMAAETENLTLDADRLRRGLSGTGGHDQRPLHDVRMDAP